MKTLTLRSACLTIVALFATATASMTIDFPVPDTSGIAKQIGDSTAQAQKDAASATITADKKVVEIGADGKNSAPVHLTWKVGNGPSKVLIKQYINGTETIESDNLPTSGSKQANVALGTNRFELVFLGAPVASVVVKGIEVKATTSLPKGPGTPSTARPTITADPTVVFIGKHKDEGATTLTWDAGSAHPNAEVRVRAEGRDEQLFAKSAKGTRQASVKEHKTYVYTLIDGGQQLASVTVKGKDKNKNRDRD